MVGQPKVKLWTTLNEKIRGDWVILKIHRIIMVYLSSVGTGKVTTEANEESRGLLILQTETDIH